MAHQSSCNPLSLQVVMLGQMCKHSSCLSYAHQIWLVSLLSQVASTSASLHLMRNKVLMTVQYLITHHVIRSSCGSKMSTNSDPFSLYQEVRLHSCQNEQFSELLKDGQKISGSGMTLMRHSAQDCPPSSNQDSYAAVSLLKSMHNPIQKRVTGNDPHLG